MKKLFYSLTITILFIGFLNNVFGQEIVHEQKFESIFISKPKYDQLKRNGKTINKKDADGKITIFISVLSNSEISFVKKKISMELNDEIIISSQNHLNSSTVSSYQFYKGKNYKLRKKKAIDEVYFKVLDKQNKLETPPSLNEYTSVKLKASSFGKGTIQIQLWFTVIDEIEKTQIPYVNIYPIYIRYNINKKSISTCTESKERIISSKNLDEIIENIKKFKECDEIARIVNSEVTKLSQNKWNELNRSLSSKNELDNFTSNLQTLNNLKVAKNCPECSKFLYSTKLNLDNASKKKDILTSYLKIIDKGNIELLTKFLSEDNSNEINHIYRKSVWEKYKELIKNQNKSNKAIPNNKKPKNKSKCLTTLESKFSNLTVNKELLSDAKELIQFIKKFESSYGDIECIDKIFELKSEIKRASKSIDFAIEVNRNITGDSLLITIPRSEDEYDLTKLQNPIIKLNGLVDNSRKEYSTNKKWTLKLKLKEDYENTVEITDDYNRIRSYPIDTRKEVLKIISVIGVEEEADTIYIQAKGGYLPLDSIDSKAHIFFYTQKIKNASYPLLYPIKIADSVAYFRIEKSALPEVLHGAYKIAIVDSSNIQSALFPKEVFIPKQISLARWPYVFVIISVLILAALFFIMRRKRRSDYLGLSNKKAKDSVTSIDPESSPEKFSIKESKIIIKNKSREKIGLIDKDTVTSGAFDKLKGYISHFACNTYWNDSAIRNIHMHEDTLNGINKFIQEENILPFKENESEPVLEIGGFLLGKYIELEDESYDVYLDKFLAVTPEKSGIYMVEFGPQAWNELVDFQDKYDNLETIGWFHTHPGHGLFLSLSDLQIQNGFFNRPYNLAMEIDTKTENLDTAFFTWQKNGEINNKQNLKPGIMWSNWNNIFSGAKSLEQNK